MSGREKILTVVATTLVVMGLWYWGGPGARLGLILLVAFYLVSEGYIWFLRRKN